MMAAAHYQFEAIHPLSDGNGRTGRILNVLMLCEAGLLHLPVLYLSRYIIETKQEYYQRLRAVTADNAWEPRREPGYNPTRTPATTCSQADRTPSQPFSAYWQPMLTCMPRSTMTCQRTVEPSAGCSS